MARYEHLPIFKKAMELCVYLDGVVRHFSRYHKYSLGSDLRDASRNILTLIIRANSEAENLSSLKDLVEQCEALKTMIVFGKEVKAFQNFEVFQHAAALSVVLCRQSQGWLNWKAGKRKVL